MGKKKERDNQIPWQRRIPLGVSKRVGASDVFFFFLCWRRIILPSGPIGRKLGIKLRALLATLRLCCKSL